MDQVVKSFKSLSVAVVSDALDRLGLPGACLGVTPLTDGYCIVGRAFTVKYIPVGAEKGTVGDYVDDVAAGNVIVLDNAGRSDCTVWGDLLTTVAHRKGIAGTVIYGVCRDVARSLELHYPIFSCGRFMRTGKDRVQVEGVNVPVAIKDVQIRPGDMIMGSEDGVLVVPQEKEEQVLKLATQVEEAEAKIRSEILAGARLDEARRKYGYHALQRQSR